MKDIYKTIILANLFLFVTSNVFMEQECDIENRYLSIETKTDDSKYPGGYIHILTDDCPGYDYTSQSTPNKPLTLNKDISLPLQPKLSNDLIYTGLVGKNGTKNFYPILGAIGVTINGVSIFGNSNLYKEDAYIAESHTFDVCGGHPTPDGEYHYHQEPAQSCLDVTGPAGTHSPLFGILYDGIPIYGPQGDDGAFPTDLDECGGHVDQTHPYYHYHLPKDRAFPYVSNCFRGCLLNSNGNSELDKFVKTLNTCNLAEQQYNYTEAFKHVTTDFQASSYSSGHSLLTNFSPLIFILLLTLI